MLEREKELMDRYIYEVIRRVPADQKEEIRLELAELIGDMYEEQQDMEEALGRLGDPKLFARKYMDDTGYVIGPDYYENYMWVLKIVLACIAGSAVVSMLVWIITGEMSLNRAVARAIGDGIVSIVGGFGTVTLVFAVLERQKIKVDLKTKEKWNVDHLRENASGERLRWHPGQLEPVPDKRALISRGESGFSLVFIAVFCGLLIFAPGLFGAYVFDDGRYVKSIPMFNLDKWSYILPLLLVGIVTDFVDQMIRLIKGCYCQIVMISSIISGLISLAAAFVAIKVFPFFNLSFMEEASKEFGWNVSSRQDLLYYWGSDFLTNLLLGIICMITVIEIGVTIYKTYRYGVSSAK